MITKSQKELLLLHIMAVYTVIIIIIIIRMDKKGEDAQLHKVISLLENKDSMAAGLEYLLYLLKELTEKKERSFLAAFLSSYPDCGPIFHLMELSTNNQDNAIFL